MVQQIKAPPAKSNKLSSILEPWWWTEGTNLHIHAVAQHTETENKTTIHNNQETVRLL